MNKTEEIIKDMNVLSIELKPGKETLKDSIEKINHACDQLEPSGQSAVLIFKLAATGLSGLKPVSDEQPDDLDIYLINKWEKALRRVETQDFITVSTVDDDINGYALSLLMTTDYRIMNNSNNLSLKDEDARVMPGMLIHRLTQQIGYANARKLVLWGASIDSQQAFQLGIVDKVTDDVETSTNHLVARLDDNICRDLAVRRRLMNEAISNSYEDALGTHLAACDRFIRNH